MVRYPNSAPFFLDATLSIYMDGFWWGKKGAREDGVMLMRTLGLDEGGTKLLLQEENGGRGGSHDNDDEGDDIVVGIVMAEEEWDVGRSLLAG